MDTHYPYQPSPLSYACETLSPNINGDTSHSHRGKYLQIYVDNLNTVPVDCPECQSKPLDELLRSLDRLPDSKHAAIRNNSGEAYNHLLCFDGIYACHSSHLSGGPVMSMGRDFDSSKDWKEQMETAALGQFGSGYTWPVSEASGKLFAMKLPNQDCLLPMGLWSVLCLDVWKHTYYLDYQNRRVEYVGRWFERANQLSVQEWYEGCRQ